jgi:uncharacterized membrane protein
MITRSRHRLAFVLLVIWGASVAVPSAHGQFRVCNHHESSVQLAIGFPTSGEWITRGWYSIDAGSCSEVLRSISSRYYYVTYDVKGATDSPLSEGEHLLCVEAGDFTIFGMKNCAQRGYQSRLFSEIDTGQQKIAWYQLDLTTMRAARKAVEAVRVRMRRSLLDQNTQVMTLRNVHPYYISFDLRCYKRSGQSTLLPISIEGSKTTEVGFVQGWTGNFVSGERCEAYYDGEQLWSYTVR